MQGGSPVITHPMEDYLGAIYRELTTDGLASTSQVARRLGVSAASTTYMFKRLAAGGLVQYREYAGVALTPSGVRFAVLLVRRHRVVERFLTDLLQIPWDQVDVIADKMEHTTPAEVVDRLDALLGHPSTCPHGYPIPDREGQMPALPTAPLSQLQPGEERPISSVAEHDADLLRYLRSVQMVPGARVRLIKHDPGQGLTQLEVNQRTLVLDSQVTGAVRVAAAESGSKAGTNAGDR